MPQIIVIADRAQRRDGPVMFTERVSVKDFESEHFQGQLVERLGWAVGDADAVECGHAGEELAAAESADDWDDVPLKAGGRETIASTEPQAATPERPRRGRLSVVAPAS